MQHKTALKSQLSALWCHYFCNGTPSSSAFWYWETDNLANQKANEIKMPHCIYVLQSSFETYWYIFPTQLWKMMIWIEFINISVHPDTVYTITYEYVVTFYLSPVLSNLFQLINIMHLPISFKIVSLAQYQWNNYTCASEVALRNMQKIDHKKHNKSQASCISSEAPFTNMN